MKNWLLPILLAILLSFAFGAGVYWLVFYAREFLYK